MKYFCMTTLTLVFFISHAFGYSCYFRPYSGDIRVADNINGGQIYTLFSSHLTKESDDVVEGLTSFRGSMLEYVAEAHRYRNEYTDRTNSERSDFRQLSLLLSSRSIDWIGIEKTGFNFQRELRKYLRYKEVIIGQMEVSPFWSQQDTDDLLYLIFPVGIKIVLEYPDIYNRIRIVPLEDATLHEEAGRLFNQEVSRLDNQMSSLDRSRMSLSQKVFLIFLDDYIFNSLASGLDMPYSSQDIEEVLEGSNLFEEDSDALEFIREILDWLDNMRTNFLERDIFAVQTILKQVGNGVILRGGAHKENVESGLTQACLESTSL